MSILVAALGITTFSFVTDTVENDFEIAKNLDIFASLYRELNTYYVDDVKPSKIIRKGINAMLKSLDPYTDFISETEIEDYRFLTTGQYGGIGSVISKKGKYVIITEPYEGYPAQKAGLRAGDKLIEIDGESAIGKNVDQISKILKGQPKTDVTIKVERHGVVDELVFKLTREKIKVKNVPYSGMVNDSIGYIRLRGFTQGAGKEVRTALIQLKENSNLIGVILDLRGNPGGLLNEAVNVSNVFVDKGKEVVRTKGKVSEWDKLHKTTKNPVDRDIPLAVLVSRSSASASEIVSGVFQDYDRGVVVGQKTFGKGLVQSTRPLAYNTQLKVTTAKYYIPSGRCIQALDYSNRNKDGSVGKIADTLTTEFLTTNGRKVYDGGGIKPDIKIDVQKLQNISISLLSKRIIFDFATEYRSKHDSILPIREFQITENLWKEFSTYIEDKDYNYTTRSELSLEDFKKHAEKENYFESVKETYEELTNKIEHDKDDDVKKYKEEICDEVKRQIASRYYYQRGKIEASFDYDNGVSEAVAILSDEDQYNAILNPLITVDNERK